MEHVKKPTPKKQPPSISVRFRNSAVRKMLRQVSELEGISQRELIEEAVSTDLTLRGARLASDLELAASRLRALSASAYRKVVDRSIEEFAEAEGLPEPIRARATHSAPEFALVGGIDSSLAKALAAFESDLKSQVSEGEDDPVSEAASPLDSSIDLQSAHSLGRSTSSPRV